MKFLAGVTVLFAFNFLSAQEFNLSFTGEKDFHGTRNVTICDNNLYDLDFDYDKNPSLRLGFKLYKNISAIKISKYDSRINLVLENELFNNGKIAGPFTPEIKKLNSKLVLLYSQLSKNEGKISIMISEIDKNSLSLIEPKEVLVINQDDLRAGKAIKLLDSYKLSICQSGNNQNFAVVYTSGQDNDLYFSILDENLKVIKRVAESIQNIEILNIQSFALDNQTNFFAGYNGENVIVFPVNSDKKVLKINIPGNVSKQVFVVPSEANTPVKIIGLYGDDKKSMKGCYILPLAPNYNPGNLEINEFPDSIKNKYSAAITDFGHTNYYLRKYPLTVLPCGDGSIVLLCQCVRHDTYSSSGVGSSITTTFGEILHIHLNSEKGIIFTEIPRTEFPMNEVSSVWKYFAFANSNNSILFYLEWAKAFDKERKGIVLAAVVVKPDGSLSRQIIHSPDMPPGFTILSTGIQQVSSTEFFIPIIKEKYKVTMVDSKTITEKLINGKVELN
jgi:hypothetical protein